MLRDSGDHRIRTQCGTLMEIVKQMKFFKESIVPLNDDEAYMIAKKLKYEFMPKGKAIRRAMTESTKMYYIMVGKAVCSFPSAGE